MKSQLIDAWRINNRMNLLLIDQAGDEGLNSSLSSRGGRTVFEQFVHVHQVRLNWLETAGSTASKKLHTIEKAAGYDKSLLKQRLEESGSAIESLIEESWNRDGKVKGFKKGLIPFIAYFIAHDSHHRGHAMLTMKQCGIKIPDSLKWGLWDWDK